jgi:hypothetical protein
MPGLIIIVYHTSMMQTACGSTSTAIYFSVTGYQSGDVAYIHCCCVGGWVQVELYDGLVGRASQGACNAAWLMLAQCM